MSASRSRTDKLLQFKTVGYPRKEIQWVNTYEQIERSLADTEIVSSIFANLISRGFLNRYLEG